MRDGGQGHLVGAKTALRVTAAVPPGVPTAAKEGQLDLVDHTVGEGFTTARACAVLELDARQRRGLTRAAWHSWAVAGGSVSGGALLATPEEQRVGMNPCPAVMVSMLGMSWNGLSRGSSEGVSSGCMRSD